MKTRVVPATMPPRSLGRVAVINPPQRPTFGEIAGGAQMSKTRGVKITFDWKRALIPLSLATMFVLKFGFNVPLWILLVFCMWMPIYFVAIPWVIGRKWREFEKEFAIRFQKKEYRQLLEYYRDQWLLRKFGPKGEMLAKLGLIYFALERYREAEHALERAIDNTQGAFREQLFYNLANVKFELGKYEEAEQIYRSLKKHSPYRQSSQTQLALIDLHRGQRIDEARQILEKERERATGSLRDRIDEALDEHPAKVVNP